MLNLAIIGLLAVTSGFTGNATTVPSTSSTNSTQIQQLEAGKKDESKEISTEAYVRNYFSDIPILVEVARCESEFRQTDKNGNVLRGVKDPRDVGVMQINEHYHLKKSKELGYDIHTIEGNTAYARYLYEGSEDLGKTGEGAKPWMASSACWAKVKELAVKPSTLNES